MHGGDYDFLMLGIPLVCDDQRQRFAEDVKDLSRRCFDFAIVQGYFIFTVRLHHSDFFVKPFFVQV